MREHDRGRRDGALGASLSPRARRERGSRDEATITGDCARTNGHRLTTRRRFSRAQRHEQAKTTESYRRFVRATVSYYAAAIAMGEVLQRVAPA